MTDDIRKAAEAYVKACDSGKFYGVGLSRITEYQALKAALKPKFAKKECISWLEQVIKHTLIDLASIDYAKQTIEYLREEQDDQ